MRATTQLSQQRVVLPQSARRHHRLRTGACRCGAEPSPSPEKVRLNAVKQTKRVALLVRQWDEMSPFDASFNFAAYVWQQMTEIPQEHKLMLLDELSDREVSKLWDLSRVRQKSPVQWDAATNFQFNLNSELCGQGDGIVKWEGRAAYLPTRFQLLFKTTTKAKGEERPYPELFGRTNLGWLVQSRVPLYYSVKFGAVIPHSGEPADCALLHGGPEVVPPSVQYSAERKLLVASGGAAAGAEDSWPPPYDPPYPLDSMRTYLRLVSPGVFVGLVRRDGAALPALLPELRLLLVK